jgi:outer membrane lipoprotein carrier protein
VILGGILRSGDVRRLFCSIVVCVCFAVAGLAVAEDLLAPQVVAGFQSWLDGTRDLQGSFEQALVSGALGAGLEERGRLYVKRPGRMRWDYRDPDTKVAIVDGDRTWLYLEEESQLFLGRLEGDGDLLSILIAAERPINGLFESDLVATPDDGGDGAYLLRLRPIPAAESFDLVVISLRPPRFAVESAEVLDAAGNRMLYRFSRFRRNKGLPEALFRFDPPDGTTIVGSH